MLADGFAGVGGAVLPVGSGINRKPENAADVVAHLLRDGAPGVEFAGLLAADGAVDQPGHVALRVLQVEILRAIVGDGHGPQLVVGEVQRRIASGCRNIDLRQRVTEVGVACPRSLACVDDLAAGIAGVIDAAVLADSVSAGVIAETDHFRVAGSIGAGHLLQLAAVLPTVTPCAVIGKIADLVRCFQIGEYEV